MTDYYDIRRLALILAVQAEIEAMKVENLLNPGKYTYYDFKDKAEELRSLAYAHNEQI
jgi:hypothetical protein